MNGFLNKILQTEGEDYVIRSDTDHLILFRSLVDKFLSNKSDDVIVVAFDTVVGSSNNLIRTQNYVCKHYETK